MTKSNIFLTEFKQTFNTEENANTFVSMMSKYIPSEQIITDGRDVTVKASNKSESWFICIFTTMVLCKRAGVEAPAVIVNIASLLGANLHDSEVAEKIVEGIEADIRITQQKFMDICKDFSDAISVS